MTDNDLIDNILSQYSFLKQKCKRSVELRGGATEYVESISYIIATHK